ncbi:hypothetical protein WJ438_22200 [Streptomyces sp. GD-15H]|uniref:hypothetical protein n=1 Tax=Streptomyces sp. GD-15H TaxID=3129112 RepID=UPI00324484FF
MASQAGRTQAQLSELCRETAAILLLDNSAHWRLRANERIDMRSANWCDRRKSIQALPLREPLADLLEGVIDKGQTHVQLYLPVGSFPRSPSFDFSVTVDGEPAFLIEKSRQAHIQARHIALLAKQAKVPMEDRRLLEEWLRSIVGFASSPWQDIRSHNASIRLRNYLNENRILGDQNGQINKRTINNWLNAVDSVTKKVRSLVPSQIDSAAEYPLLALPEFRKAFSDEAKVTTCLESLTAFLNEVKQKANQGDDAAAKLMGAYAASGIHWNAIVECTVPLDKSFLIETSEKRGLDLTAAKPWGRRYSKQPVVFRDARSNHVSILVTDTNVELTPRKTSIFDEKGVSLKGVGPDFQHSTREFMSFSDSGQRPEKIVVKLPLGASLPAAISRSAILTLTLTALVAFVVFLFNWLGAGGDSQLSGQDVGVILVPTAIAASLLLVRETSTLSTELNKGWVIATSSVLMMLWLGTLLAYGTNRISWGVP